MALAPFLIVASILLCFAQSSRADTGSIYKIGVGRDDVTGPAAEVNMMGYGKIDQSTSGIHIRQYARSFIIDDGRSRILFISLDTGMASQVVYLKVLKALKEKYGDLYTEKNVCLSCTHTHSGPAGYLQYVLYIVTSQGFVRQSFDAIIDGVMKSVDKAHRSIQPGYIFMNSGDLYNASINRSPASYLNNPPEERARYDSNVDTKMVLLKMTDLNQKPIGMINWFAVHCTSMNNSNVYISGDNKGYASLQFEKLMDKASLPGQSSFVAAFAQSNEGDVSPNTKGPRCVDTGLPCDEKSSTCNGQNGKCIAFGPGKDMFESTKIIGSRQYEKAVELFELADTPIKGPILSQHQYVDMTNIYVPVGNTTFMKTCKPAMGYSFAAGTTDGPGGFSFKQGSKSSSFLWNLIRDRLATPTAEDNMCQHPKPIFLATGRMNVPYAWQPSIVPTQILKVGQLAIVAVPGEFTTMSGRRLRNSVKNILDSSCVPQNNEVVIAGLSNTYASYVTTYEEYQVQRYEGASTIYGPHTLQAYVQQFSELAKSICTNGKLPEGPRPPYLLDKQIGLLPGVVYDAPYAGQKFGDVILDAKKQYTPGSVVSVKFVSGHPRNNLQHGKTFLTVERLDPGTGNWAIIATDANWETKYLWKRTTVRAAHSEAKITWEIPNDVISGQYRIRHFGHSKNVMRQIIPYVGTSRKFTVKNS